MNRFADTLFVTVIVLLVFASFVLGQRWEANQIRLSIENTGEAVLQWGDNDCVKIKASIIKRGENELQKN